MNKVLVAFLAAAATAPRTAAFVVANVTPRTTTTTTLTLMREQPYLKASTERGVALMGAVLAVNVWLFSIPVELRREEICVTKQPIVPCVTFSEWAGKVREYYANGGGVQFDFSIQQK